MKKGPFKLKSGNKPSMAKLAGVSPVKKDEKVIGSYDEKFEKKKLSFKQLYEQAIKTPADKRSDEQKEIIRRYEKNNPINKKKKGFDFTGTGNFKFPKDYAMKKYSDYTKYDDDRD